MKRVLAVIVLSSSLLNRGTIAGQILDAVQAGHPGATCTIETRAGADGLVPHKDEDWEFEIIIFEAADVLKLGGSPFSLD